MKQYINRLSILIISFVILAAPLLFTAPAVHAEKFDATLGDFQKALDPNKGYNKETFDYQSFVGLSASLVTMLNGCTEPSCPKTIRTGAMYKVTDTMAMLYENLPASGIYYAMDLSRNLNFAQPAYAQTGTGFNMLVPFLDLWRAIRNMTYILFVIGIVALGLMVMFRTKISPQAVLTVQAALPRIVVGLILITFSYAIVGFIIDLIYVVFAILAYGIQAGNIPGYNANTTFKDFSNANFGNTAGFILGQGFQGVKDVVGGAIGGNRAIGVGTALVTIVAAAAAIWFPVVAISLGTALLPLVLGLFITIIAFLIRALVTLARAYLTLLVYLIFGPLIILWVTISGRSIWDSWLKPVTANAGVFLATGILIFIANLFIAEIDRYSISGRTVFGPPYLGSQVTVLKGIIALAAVVLLPQLPDIINQFLSIRTPGIQIPGGRLAEQYAQNVSGSLARTPLSAFVSRFRRTGTPPVSPGRPTRV